MDFFSAQDHARRQSVLLLVWFALSVCTVVGFVYFLARWALRLESALEAKYWNAPAPPWWDPTLFGWVVLLVGGLILGGSLYKSIVLARGGGHAVAQALGARLVARSSKVPYERQLVNVVDEIAIASGIVPPRVYIMDREPSLNAFAAGTQVSKAAVIVTRGLLEHLERDELQSVVAHEFGHILNGDMRLNMRLAGLLHGILLVTLLGKMLLTPRVFMVGHEARHRALGHGGHAPNVTFPMMATGVGLVVIGSLGLLLGNIIKAAVSRQREYLADASAVQFTRYPEALARALGKIADGGSKVHHHNADEFSHMFFSANRAKPASHDPIAAWFATHPPIEERIKRLDPSGRSRQARSRRQGPVWHMPPIQPKTAPDEAHPPVADPLSLSSSSSSTPLSPAALSAPRAPYDAAPASASLFEQPPPDLDAILTSFLFGKKKGEEKREAAAAGERVLNAASVTASVGDAQGEHLAHTRYWLRHLPVGMVERLRESAYARCVALGLLLCGDEAIRQQQRSDIARRFDETTAQESLACSAWLARAHPALRLPLLDMALSTLGEQPPGARSYLADTCDTLIRRQSQPQLMSNVLCSLITHALRPQGQQARATMPSPATLRADAAHLLAWLALAGHAGDAATARQAWQAASGALALKVQWPFADDAPPQHYHPTPRQLEQVLNHLAATRATFRKNLVAACTQVILHDGNVTALEAELLRAVGQALDCPVPPHLHYANIEAAPPPPAREPEEPAYAFDWKSGIDEERLEQPRRRR